jgi:hypothetical protein
MPAPGCAERLQRRRAPRCCCCWCGPMPRRHVLPKARCAAPRASPHRVVRACLNVPGPRPEAAHASSPRSSLARSGSCCSPAPVISPSHLLVCCRGVRTKGRRPSAAAAWCAPLASMRRAAPSGRMARALRPWLSLALLTPRLPTTTLAADAAAATGEPSAMLHVVHGADSCSMVEGATVEALGLQPSAPAASAAVLRAAAAAAESAAAALLSAAAAHSTG